MSLATIARVPFTLSATWAVQTILTSPKAPENEKQRIEPFGPESYLLTRGAKAAFMLAGMAEMMSIYAALYPGTFHSNLITNFLIWTQSAESVGVSLPFLIGWVFCMAGAIVRRECYKSLKNSFGFELNMTTDDKLVTTGPYAYVRHPSYSSAIVGLLGALTCHTTSGSWLSECSGLLQAPWAAPTIAAAWIATLYGLVNVVIPRIRLEDNMMRGRFRGKWDVWAINTPNRLIPGVY